MVALMALGLRRDDKAMLSAAGTDAGAAVTAIATLIESGMDELEPVALPPAPQTLPPTGDASVLRGLIASPGLTVGSIAHFRPAAIEVPIDGVGVAAEEHALIAHHVLLGDGDAAGKAMRAHILAANERRLTGHPRTPPERE